jgi:hypothetical protein
LRFAGHQTGAMLFQFALDLGEDFRMIFRDVDFFTWVLGEVKQERWIMFFECDWRSRAGLEPPRHQGFASRFCPASGRVPSARTSEG